MYKLFKILFLLNILINLNCITSKPKVQRLFGVTLVAPERFIEENPLLPAHKMGFGWTAIVPYAYIRPNSTTVIYDTAHPYMYWGETPNGIRGSVQWAHAIGMQAMLKPQVWAARSWIGNIRFDSETQWKEFEHSYAQYILKMAQIAQEEKVALFCIGTELSAAALERTSFWVDLIAQIRKIYSGKLTYSCNWDNWEKCPLWSQLDYIGLGSYFPLSTATNPSPDTLRQAWKPVVGRLEQCAKKYKKPVLFTEMGYLAVPGCCGRLWELEPHRTAVPPDPQCQALAFNVLLETFCPQSWWAGGFVWKYYAQNHFPPDYGPQDYDIQQKPAVEAVFEYWLKQKNP